MKIISEGTGIDLDFGYVRVDTWDDETKKWRWIPSRLDRDAEVLVAEMTSLPDSDNFYAPMAFLALLPILTVFVLIVLFRWPATKAMPVAFLITCLLAFSIWKAPVLQIAAASIDGLVTAGSIHYIILGAILLLNLQ